MSARVFLVVFGCIFFVRGSELENELPGIEVPNRRVTKSLMLSNGLDWGKWGEVEYCSEGSFVQDIEIKFEDYSFLDTDETALNGVKLYCSKSDGHITEYVTSTVGTKGDWKGMKSCKNGLMTGFRARVLPAQGTIGDDVAVQNVEMECNYGESTVLAMDENVGIHDGTFGLWAKCDKDSAICGIEIRYNQVDLITDDAAVSDISMFCCALDE
ncbi:vitelline membrane outer layer protein 1-like [Palaemon carinicauda]|uniref:vitelline membrane outer layer protein 1-like n=1 Tax=Palaemon carinicauda TaxID=392227 RepID=UPI0035B5BB1C